MAPTLRHQQSEPLSPRQLFQGHVRNASTEQIAKGHRRNKSISLKYNPYELQHVSGLCVQDQNIVPSSRSPATSKSPALRQVQQEPDFILEEREAWARRSPATRTARSPKRHSQSFLIYDESATEDEGQQGQSLQPFAPMVSMANANRRPKTSRGLTTAPLPTNFAQMRDHYALQPSPTRSKFFEGSMTNRSLGTASSWTEHASDYEDSGSEIGQDTDDDSTPKALKAASKHCEEACTISPPSASSTKVRKTLFRRTSSHKPLDDRKAQKKERKIKAGDDGEKQTKRRVRKSLSSWSLHGLGEKMGIFNNSSNSVDSVADYSENDSLQLSDETKSVLNERKRKAEIVYAEQFGPKKQKDSPGPTTATSSKYSTVRKGPAGPDPNATIKARLSATAHRTSLGPSDLAAVFAHDNVTEHDARKRPSRRELEKENQQLREMLRRSQSGRVNDATLRQQFDLKQAQSNACARNQDHHESVSPVEILPPPRRSSRRKSADSLQVSQGSRILSPNIVPTAQVSLKPAVSHARSASDLKPRPSLPELPRSFAMIVEEPEGEESTDLQAEKRSKFQTRARRSIYQGISLKTSSITNKENSQPMCSVNVPSIVISGVVDGRNVPRSEWQGWDDDVF